MKHFLKHHKKFLVYGSLVFFLISISISIYYFRYSIRNIHDTITPSVLNAERNKLFSLLTDKDPRAAMDQLQADIVKNPALANSCHALLHELGRKSYEKYHDFGKAIRYQKDMCLSGYTHGVLEKFFSQTKDIASAMKNICIRNSDNKYLLWECYHGIGNGLMYYSYNNLPSSLKYCLTFSDDFSRSACASGVYMENFSSDSLHPSRFVRRNNPLYPCTENVIYKENCYRSAPFYYLRLMKYDYSHAFTWCDSGEKAFRNDCYAGVGAQMMRVNIDNPKLVEKICLQGGADRSLDCILGMVGYYSENFDSISKTRSMCNTLSQHVQHICLLSLERKEKYLQLN